MNGPTEFVKKPLELKVYGREVKLSRPTFGQAQEWKKKIKGADPENALDTAAEMLKACGMPDELMKDLELEHFQAIQELLLGSKKKLTEDDLEIAKLCQFYGYLPSQLRSEEPEDVSMLWQAITPLEARDMLMAIRISEFPHHNPQYKRKLVDALNDEAFPFAEKRAITWEEAGQMIGQGAKRG